MLRFFLEGAAAEFLESYTNHLANMQGVEKDKIFFNWQQLSAYLTNCFSGRESYEALEAQLKSIKLATHDEFMMNLVE
jgi:hypothetical protein